MRRVLSQADGVLMNHDKDDKKISELFQHLRQEDEKRMPSFARVWATALTKNETRRPTAPLFRLALAVAVLVVVVGSGLFVFRQTRIPSPATAVSITQWQSPTLALLRFPGSRLTRSRRLLEPGDDQEFTVSLSQWQPPTASLTASPGKRRSNRYHRQF